MMFFKKILHYTIKTALICQCFFIGHYLYAQADSPLSGAQVYKLGCSHSGMYKLTYSWLRENTDINLNALNTDNLRMWSGKKSLKEVAISAIGGEDGRFDPNDYLLFYGEGPNQDISGYTNNPYSDKNYYFLTIDNQPGKRVTPQNLPVNTNAPQTSSKKLIVYEEDLVNLLEESNNNSGSGQVWVGSEISNNGTTSLNPYFDLNDGATGPVKVKGTIVVRSDQNEKVRLRIGNNIYDRNVGGVQLGDPEERYARIIIFEEELDLTEDQLKNMSIEIEFNKASPNAQAWIDYVAVEYYRKNNFRNGHHVIYPQDASAQSVAISTDFNPVVWYYSGAESTIELNVEKIDDTYFITPPGNQPLIVFNPSEPLLLPSEVTKLQALNIRNIVGDMVVIYHPLFQSQAARFAEHRMSYSQLKVELVNVFDIYNEYGSGQATPEALRWFVKDVWEKNQNFRYVLLFGDGSYDYRGLSVNHDFQNFVPTYETYESFDPILSFPTDDYFALLDEDQPESLTGDLDIAIGRFTVRTEAEAEAVVSKIIHYDTSRYADASWKTNIAFLADDEDFNLHLNDADRIADDVSLSHPEFNVQKIYWDAFVQQSTPGGNRYPDANRRINQSIDQGLLVMNYLGHGGPIGWSQERVLNISDIDSWVNFGRLPLIVTATCSFTGFDDPNITSAGEAAFINPVGGAIALYTTVRSVYASKNFRLTQSVFDTLFKKDNGRYLSIGEVLRRSKNSNPSDNTNARKFLLIGDPSLHLNLPELIVSTFSINGKDINDSPIDTLGALSTIEIKGGVISSNGEIVSNFDGIVDITVFDKANSVKTLANDPTSFSRSFTVQNNIIFKGKASVNKGLFSFKFTVPVDIDYSPGNGKVSYYAQSNTYQDAMGYYNKLILSGTDNQIIGDDKGPDINLFINDYEFTSGGETGPNPVLLAQIEDDNGINISTTSIGHEIIAILDDDTQNTIILNDYYTAPVDGFNKGTITYPFYNLSPGPHSIKLRAFDVANNLGEASIDFIVKEEKQNSITDLSCFPNPLTERTTFSFRHNINASALTATVEIYDISGTLMQSLSGRISSATNIRNNIFWNGAGYNNSVLAKGTYLYRLKITSPDLPKVIFSEFKKMVILK